MFTGERHRRGVSRGVSSVGTHRVNARRGVGGAGFAGGGSLQRAAAVAPGQRTAAATEATSQVRAEVAKFFVDLRRTIGASAAQASQHLKTPIPVISALERADVGALPPWPETQRIVLAYTAWAGIDGRPVLTALGILLTEAKQRRQTEQQAAAVRPAVSASSERLRQIRLAISEGARRLPQEAFNHVRQRPVRTFYALSTPLALLMLSLHPHFFRDAANFLSRPVSAVVSKAEDIWAVNFAPRREGFRWIEVSDPRNRRDDKLKSRE